MLVKDPKYFLESLQRMYLMNQGFPIANEEESFEIILRPDTGVVDGMDFEIVILYNPGKDPNGTFRGLLEREGYETDDDEFVLDDFYIPQDAGPDSESVAHAMKIVNTCYTYMICSCNKYLIRDSKPMCCYCHMTATEEDMKQETCTICHEETAKRGMRSQSCCKQYVHLRCISKWTMTNPTCPVCRAETK